MFLSDCQLTSSHYDSPAPLCGAASSLKYRKSQAAAFWLKLTAEGAQIEAVRADNSRFSSTDEI